MTRTGVRDKTLGGPSEGCLKNQGRGVCREELAEERGLGCIGWDFKPFIRGFPFDMYWKSRVSEERASKSSGEENNKIQAHPHTISQRSGVSIT